MNNHEIFSTIEEQTPVNTALRSLIAARLFVQKTAPHRNPLLTIGTFTSLGLTFAIFAFAFLNTDLLAPPHVVHAEELFANASNSLANGFARGDWLTTSYLIHQEDKADQYIASWTDGHEQRVLTMSNRELALSGENTEDVGHFFFSQTPDIDSETGTPTMSSGTFIFTADQDISGGELSVTGVLSPAEKNLPAVLPPQDADTVIAAIRALSLDGVDCDAACSSARASFTVVGEENIFIPSSDEHGQDVMSYKLVAQTPNSEGTITTIWLAKDGGNFLKLSQANATGATIYEQTITDQYFVAADALPTWIQDSIINVHTDCPDDASECVLVQGTDK